MAVRTIRLSALPALLTPRHICSVAMGAPVLRRSARLVAAAGLASAQGGLSNTSVSTEACSKKVGLKRRKSNIVDDEPERSSAFELAYRDLIPKLSSSLVCSADKKQEELLCNKKAVKRFPSRDLEAELWGMGFRFVAGVDEAGRGPLAGPVVAAACIISPDVVIEGINDSKKLSEDRREELYTKLTSTPGVLYAVHVVDAVMIDDINILEATLKAMAGCVEKLRAEATGISIPDFILVDGNRLPSDFSPEKSRFVVKGDATCHVIAAASVLAKVTRDRIMVDHDRMWPQYGFKQHKGYGTAAHMKALLKHGPCAIHRRSFAPLKYQLLASVAVP